MVGIDIQLPSGNLTEKTQLLMPKGSILYLSGPHNLQKDVCQSLIER